MDRDQFLKRRREITTTFEQEKNNLAIFYAKANNPIKEGDIIKDHCNTIKVETTQFIDLYSEEPGCRYYGPLVNKDGSLNKTGKKDWVYQKNVSSINKVEYRRNGVIINKLC